MRLTPFAALVGMSAALCLSSPAQTATAGEPASASVKSTPASNAGPADPKARQTYDEARKLAKARNYLFALDKFRKADKQDGGHCLPCEVEAYKAARQIQDYKAAREQTALMLEHVTTPIEKAQVHALAGQACLAEGAGNNHEKPFQAADSEFQAALQLAPNKTDCLYSDGVALAHLKQDGAARERFQQFLKIATPTDLDYTRAQKFADNPELARARMVPNFRLTSSDGQTVSLDSLAGKVVLVDFWATWCGPCREALPNVKKLAHKFSGQPFAVVSVSLDKDDAKWRDFIAKNGMTWTQARDGGGDGSIAHLFGVTAIPATFTMDADGVLQDQHVGDAEIEGKIRKLIARANELSSRKTVAEVR